MIHKFVYQWISAPDLWFLLVWEKMLENQENARMVLGIYVPILSHHLPCQLYSWCTLCPSLALEFGEVPFVLQQASADASPYHTIPSIQPAHDSAALPNIVLIRPAGPTWTEVHGWFLVPSTMTITTTATTTTKTTMTTKYHKQVQVQVQQPEQEEINQLYK